MSADKAPVGIAYTANPGPSRKTRAICVRVGTLASARRSQGVQSQRPSDPDHKKANIMAFAIAHETLDSAVNGDTAALDHVLRMIRPHVERQLLRYPVSDEDRRDLLQATLMQIVRRLGSFRAESSFSTWLFRVTANEALMLMRSRRRHRARVVEGLDWEELATLPSVNDNEVVQVDTGAANRERDARVRDALKELPEDYRDVVVAHYHLDLGLQEIADKLAITESAVRSRLHRARTRLRTLLERDEVVEYTRAA